MENIGAANAGDPFYRYRMPKPQLKPEGRGNGAKTRITNLFDIAAALRRPGSYIVKYLQQELGTRVSVGVKAGETRHVTVMGSHDAASVSAVLERFIRTFVQCSRCGNPETAIEGGRALGLRCGACGHVTDMDPSLRLCAFISRDRKRKRDEAKPK